MRVFVTLLAIIMVLGWVGFEIRPRYREVSNVLFVFAGLLSGLLFAFFFDLI